MLEVTFANSLVREYDELMDQANSLKYKNRALESSAFITAAQALAKESPLLASPYTTFDERGWRTSTQSRRYDADTWVITSTLLSERSDAAAKVAEAWNNKGDNYKAALVVYAVALFLLALASLIGGCVRWLFLLVGLALAAVVSVVVVLNTLSPVPNIPDAALQRYAQGYGYGWQYQYDEAIRAYSQALQLYPDYANALARRGQAYFHTQPPELKKAIQDLQAASRLDSDNYSIFWNLGWAYYLLGDYAKSIEASQKSLDLNSKVCGPAFNIAIARLAMGKASEAEKEYEAAIARCEKIVKEVRATGLEAPQALWEEIDAGAQDIENLLCATHQKYCYPDREQHDVSKIVNREAVLHIGEKYLKRIKEALTALEYYNTTIVKPTGAKFDPLVFANKFYNEADEFQSYVKRERFPYRGDNIYALWNYSNVKPWMQMVWKVYRNGVEKPDLRYTEKWNLQVNGAAEKKIDSWFVMAPGRYDVEVYGDGELLSTGTFEIDTNETLVPPLARDLRPSAPVTVSNLLLYDDFVNNHRGWWTGNASADVSRLTEAKIQSGEYIVLNHKQGKVWRVTCEDCGDLNDAYYEVNTRYISGATDYGYGLIIRSDRGMNHGYLFSITPDGSFRIAKDVTDTVVSLVRWTNDPVIQVKGVNRLGVLARGNTFEFFINGKSVARVSDTSLTRGYFGLYVGTAELAIAFSQVRVWQAQ
jgi:tetratricopeptide (TPR) repeat protein